MDKSGPRLFEAYRVLPLIEHKPNKIYNTYDEGLCVAIEKEQINLSK
jgi:hypothetical protein